MAITARTLAAADALDPGFEPAWDALTLGRGIQADLYDTHGWIRAWAAAAPGSPLRVPALFEGDRPVALLPLVARPFGRWEAAGLSFRPRYRAIVEAAAPQADDLVPLAEELARRGARTLTLPVMPTRDPATAALEAALVRAGFRCRTTPGTSECLSPVEGGWAGHRSRYKKFDRTAKNFSNKGERLGPVEVLNYGAPGEAPVQDGFAAYLEIHARGWKGALGAPMIAYRRELLAATQRAGRARLYVLRIAGVAAAAIIWFRIGPVAIAFSTVYDQQLAAVSPGTVLLWQSHERIFAEGEPALVDLLPGHGPQKDQVGPESPPLVTLHAERGRPVAGFAAPLFSKARGALERVRRAVRRRARDGERPARSRATRVAPAPGAPPAEPLTLDPRTEIVLAVAGGHPSPGAMAATWIDGDSWWRAADVLVRVGAPNGETRPVREVVGTAGDPGPALAGVAAALGETLSLRVPDPAGDREPPTPVRTSRFPLDP